MFSCTTSKIPTSAHITRPILKAIFESAQKLVAVQQSGVISLASVTPAVIQRWNKEYRKKDKETDVLSFCYGDITTAHKDETIGEILVCHTVVRKQAKEYGNTLQAEWCKLIIHGVFHILGFDHETDEEYLDMKEREDAVARVLAEKFHILIK